jgi:ribonuclease HI
MDDWPAWHFDEKGIFTVKSTYKIAVAKREALAGRDGSTSDGTEFQWNKIWQLKVPNKVQMFLWRFAHSSLPVRRNLARCKRLDEDCGHIFFKCKKVKQCWRLMRMEGIRSRLEGCLTGKDTINKIWSFAKDDQLKVVVLLWRWWSARNKANDYGKIVNVAEIQSSTLFYLSEFKKLNTTSKHVAADVKSYWKTPPDDTYKVNVDGAFHSDSRTGGWGFVIRNTNGEVLASGAGNISFAASAIHTEAMAAYKGLQHAAQLGMAKIILETDATVLADTLNSISIDRSSIGCIIRQMRDFMQFEFSSCIVSVCNRNCNKVADSLATYGAYVLDSGSSVLMSQIPEFVYVLVSSDLLGCDV